MSTRPTIRPPAPPAPRLPPEPRLPPARALGLSSDAADDTRRPESPRPAATAAVPTAAAATAAAVTAADGHGPFGRLSRRRPSGDGGSSLPFVLLCFLIAAFFVAAVTAASAAFLAQRDLQADCDGAAIAAASGIDRDAMYQMRLDERTEIPLGADEAASAAERYASRTGPDDATLVVSASVDEDRVTVACTRVVNIPFGNLFGIGGGLNRSTVSTARSPLSR